MSDSVMDAENNIDVQIEEHLQCSKLSQNLSVY